ncbi:ABC transporter ATP-binding protein [Thalassovita taeanensis]|uniref:Branched-chain amino acid transport system ATP-binding protein n=1 Tax=Thalassovita taeanensis TaxID=657014 RepID=A0A1H9HB80_9RHOB|nr:ABC transporter ATP-binding protein [Thalassovita taeanensis]SEQ59584.1 branched-chain amino acid transport system ATP-binding protein [Thalassovita taeanensis]
MTTDQHHSVTGGAVKSTAVLDDSENLLSIRNLKVVYNSSIEAVRDVSLSVSAGKIVALLGANGAGKSTILKGVSGVLFTEDGEIENGSINFRGENISELMPDLIVGRGLVQVPEGRRLFAPLTVHENLVMGGHLVGSKVLAERLEFVFELFPRLKEKASHISGYLSGGEQQMVAVGRALMSDPKLLCLDEPSLGLAPQIIDEIFKVLRKLRDENGASILLVEQNAHRALEIADYAYIMENGRVVMDGAADALANNRDVKEFYLGLGEASEGKSMRDVKHYKRRKRWLS